MALHTFSFNEDVTIEVHFENVPMTKYPSVLEYISKKKPLMQLSGGFFASETDESYRGHTLEMEYEAVAFSEIEFKGEDGKRIKGSIKTNNKGLEHALACAGMIHSIIKAYKVESDKSKKFFYLTFRNMD